MFFHCKIKIPTLAFKRTVRRPDDERPKLPLERCTNGIITAMKIFEMGRQLVDCHLGSIKLQVKKDKTSTEAKRTPVKGMTHAIIVHEVGKPDISHFSLRYLNPYPIYIPRVRCLPSPLISQSDA